MSKFPIKKIKSPKSSLEWVTISGEGKENLSGKLQYVANAVVEADDPLIAEIKQFWADNIPKGFKKDAKSLGIYPHKVDSGKKDEDGKAIFEEDGKLVLTFKTGTTYGDGKVKVIQLYNAKAKKVALPEGTSIGNGTIGKIAGAMGIYENKTPKGALVDAGVTLYLNDIQIFKLEEYTTDAGFEADEEDEDDGWEGDENSFEGEEAKPETKEKPRL